MHWSVHIAAAGAEAAIITEVLTSESTPENIGNAKTITIRAGKRTSLRKDV